MVGSAFTTGRDLQFPKLMLRKDGSIVLFGTLKLGTIVYSPDENMIGARSDQWPMDEFKDLPKGSTVTITQK